MIAKSSRQLVWSSKYNVWLLTWQAGLDLCLEGAGGRLCEEGVGVAPQQVGGEGEGQGQAVHSGGQCDGRHLGKGSCYEGYVMTLLLRLPLCLKNLLRIFAIRSPGQVTWSAKRRSWTDPFGKGKPQSWYKMWSPVFPSIHLHICVEVRVEAVAAAAGLAAVVCARRHGEPRSEQTGQAASTLQWGTLLDVMVWYKPYSKCKIVNVNLLFNIFYSLTKLILHF